MSPKGIGYTKSGKPKKRAKRAKRTTKRGK